MVGLVVVAVRRVMGVMLMLAATLLVGGLTGSAPADAASGSIAVTSCDTPGLGGWCRASSAGITITVSTSGLSYTPGGRDELLYSLSCSWLGGSAGYGPDVAGYGGTVEVTATVSGDSPPAGRLVSCDARLLKALVISCILSNCIRAPELDEHYLFDALIRIDSTLPNGSVSIAPNPAVVGQTIKATFSGVSDGGSGIKSQACPFPASGSPGTFTLGCHITDNAGNSRPVDVAYTVNKADATAAITGRSGTSSVVGQDVTVSYSVTADSPAVATPTGTVTVSDGVSSCSATVAAGQCTLALTTAGDRTLTASYPGSPGVNSAVSPGVTHTVAKAELSLTAHSDVAAPTAGHQFGVRLDVALVPPGSGDPTGSVTWSNGDDSCIAPMEDNGYCLLTLLSVGTRTVTASYEGDSRFQPASATVDVDVARADTYTSATNVTGSDLVVGQDLLVAWEVAVTPTSSYGPEGGEVTVTDGQDSCTGSAFDGGCTLRLTTVGERTMVVTLAQGPWWTTSSDAFTVTVSKADTKTTMTGHSPAPSGLGSPVTVTWSVDVLAPGHGNPGGQVTVSDGEVTCSAPAGDGQCELTPTSMGTRHLTATYEGSARFNGSTSDVVNHRVKLATTTAITSVTPGPSTAPGTPFVVAFDVTGADGAPTGTVSVSWGTDQCTASVADGECTITPTGVGSKPVQAVYEGDTDFVGSTSSGVAHSVGYTFAWSGPKAPPSANTAKAGARLALRFTLGGSYGKAVLAAGYPRMQTASCRSWATSGRATGTSPAGSAGVSVSGAGVYSYGWKTGAAWFKGKPVCKVVTLKLKDGTIKTLRYRFTGKQ